jgi:hypothetical protein
MSIVLSASVRQNLLSLQSTATLLATTQNDLATGNKVNTALDNPTNFFTAQALNNRAGDINNLLDSIGNGVQVLQAANTGITSLQSLISSAQSIANQALQTPVGYSTLSNVSATIAGATATDLRGTTTYTSATATSNVVYSGAAGGTTAVVLADTLGGSIASLTTGTVVQDNQSTPAQISGTTVLNNVGAGSATTAGLGTATVSDGQTLTVNGHTITFKAGAAPATLPTGYAKDTSGTQSVATDGNGNSIIYIGASSTDSTADVADVLKAIDLASGVDTATIAGTSATIAASTGQTASAVSFGVVSLKSSTGADLSVTGSADFLKALGLTTSTGPGAITLSAARTTSSGSLGSLITAGSTLNVDNHVITFVNAQAPTAAALVAAGSSSGLVTSANGIVTDGNGNSTVYLQSAKLSDVLTAVDLATGVQTAAIATGDATVTTAANQTASTVNASGVLQISTGITSDLSITGTGNALTALGLVSNGATSLTAARTAGPGSLNGKTLNITSFNGGTAVAVTFGDGTGGTVKTLAQLNTALQANNLNATVDANGKLTISANNDYASSTLGSAAAGGVFSGTAYTGAGSLTFSTAAAPVADSAAQTTRANLVAQYNNVLQQITTTAQDSSFNGVNLLNGDQLKLVFNETGKSTLNIQGVTFNAAGLGLSNLVAGTDFIDNASTNNVLSSLTGASNTLRSEASSLGSNLSIVQIRQDFNKNLINVLQTGASNLTIADTNEEAANSQALSTRQSIAVSALALANQSQQSVLQLLR